MRLWRYVCKLLLPTTIIEISPGRRVSLHFAPAIAWLHRRGSYIDPDGRPPSRRFTTTRTGFSLSKAYSPPTFAPVPACSHVSLAARLCLYSFRCI